MHLRTSNVLRKALNKSCSSSFEPLCASLRDLIPRCIARDDVVLEVGCHVGGTTGLIGALASTTVGIDSSDFWLKEARSAYPDIRFEQVLREMASHKIGSRRLLILL